MKFPVLLGALCALMFASVARADFFLGETVDGPTSAIVQLSGLSVSHDGTGGLVEVRQDGGANHVFVSRLVNGVFGTPERIDGTLPDGSAQPAIAAGDGGELHVAFVNDGIVYVVDRLPGGTAWSTPTPIAADSSDPDIALSIHGKGYLVFTAGGTGGHDIRYARWRSGRWALIPAPLDAHPEDDAGTGTNRPRVAAAGDGEGVVVWGEAGQVMSRRVWDVNPSVVYEVASVPDLQGNPATGADMPDVGVGDDSSFALVTFRERFTQGTTTFARGLARRLRGSAYDDVVPVDGLSFPVGEDAGPPVPAVDNKGAALIATNLSMSHQTWAASAGDDVSLNGPVRMDAAPSASYSTPAAALGRDDAGLIAYERDSGLAGAAVIVRQWDGQGFGPEASVTNAAFGPTDATSGLFAAADRTGDLAVVFVQGSPSALRIVFGGFDKPPAAFAERTRSQWTRSGQPKLTWTLPTDLWGGASFDVSLDGQPLGSTRLTFLIPPRIADGVHHWQVVATDRHGQHTAANPGTVRIDTTPPIAQLKLSGTRKAGKLLRFRVRAADTPPPAAPGAPPILTSGVRKVRISFGDGAVATGSSATHRYRRGSYTVKVTVTDAAGNAVVVKSQLRIKR